MVVREPLDEQRNVGMWTGWSNIGVVPRVLDSTDPIDIFHKRGNNAVITMESYWRRSLANSLYGVGRGQISQWRRRHFRCAANDRAAPEKRLTAPSPTPTVFPVPRLPWQIAKSDVRLKISELKFSRQEQRTLQCNTELCEILIALGLKNRNRIFKGKIPCSLLAREMIVLKLSCLSPTWGARSTLLRFWV